MLHSKIAGPTLALFTMLTLAACGGGGGSSTPPPPPAVTYTISGTVAGLAGTGLVLQLNGANNLAVASGTSFAFPAAAAVNSGAAYAVTVLTQPSSPTQTCTVASGTGTATTNVTNVAVTCVTKYTVSGTVSGYSGSGLVLQLNAANNLTLTSGATTFAFPAAAAVTSGTPYAVSVQTQPGSPAQSCTVTNGNGTASANVTNVAIACSTIVTPTFTVGGTISGLTGTGLTLTNNGGAPLAVSGTTFVFPAQASGTAYAVLVATQPSSPAQSCSVANGSGTVGSANVTTIAVTCAATDVVAPTVLSTSPINTTVGTALQTAVVVNFSEPIKPSSVTTSSFTLTLNGNPVAATLTPVVAGATSATLTPNAALAFDTTYTATVTTAVQDPSSNALAANFVWRFNTGKKIAAGGRHTCARLDGTNNGKVKCWGRNLSGQLGKGNATSLGDEPGEMGAANVAIDFGTGRTVVQLEAGNDHTCARLDTGAVKCWGRNVRGQLGLGDTTDRGYYPNQMGDALPAVVLGSGTVLQVMAGLDHNCVRFADGTIKCWGDNEYGQIGQDTPATGLTAIYTTPSAAVALGAGLKAIDIQGFSRHNCARLVNASNVDQGMKCWGDNRWGQLGQGDTDNRGDNVHGVGTVTALSFAPLTISQVIATSGHSCVLLSNNSVRCWGNNWYGQLGKGVPGQVGGQNCSSADNCIGDVPGEVPGFVTVDLGLLGGVTPVELSGGDRHTCVRLSTGKIKCWGENAVGQLGLGDTNNRGDAAGEMGVFLPEVNVGPLSYVATELSVGGFSSCAVTAAGAKCWGRNDFGQLGIGDTANRGDDNDMGDLLPLIDLTP
jgi:alpha-tubulin suppressor-like RCC1 family protein